MSAISWLTSELENMAIWALIIVYSVLLLLFELLHEAGA